MRINRHRALAFCLRMILSENRFILFRDHCSGLLRSTKLKVVHEGGKGGPSSACPACNGRQVQAASRFVVGAAGLTCSAVQGFSDLMSYPPSVTIRFCASFFATAIILLAVPSMAGPSPVPAKVPRADKVATRPFVLIANETKRPEPD